MDNIKDGWILDAKGVCEETNRVIILILSKKHISKIKNPLHNNPVIHGFSKKCSLNLKRIVMANECLHGAYNVTGAWRLWFSGRCSSVTELWQFKLAVLAGLDTSDDMFLLLHINTGPCS